MRTPWTHEPNPTILSSEACPLCSVSSRHSALKPPVTPTRNLPRSAAVPPRYPRTGGCGRPSTRHKGVRASSRVGYDNHRVGLPYPTHRRLLDEMLHQRMRAGACDCCPKISALTPAVAPAAARAYAPVIAATRMRTQPMRGQPAQHHGHTGACCSPSHQACAGACRDALRHMRQLHQNTRTRACDCRSQQAKNAGACRCTAAAASTSICRSLLRLGAVALVGDVVQVDVCALLRRQARLRQEQGTVKVLRYAHGWWAWCGLVLGAAHAQKMARNCK